MFLSRLNSSVGIEGDYVVVGLIIPIDNTVKINVHKNKRNPMFFRNERVLGHTNDKKIARQAQWEAEELIKHERSIGGNPVGILDLCMS